jgi:hypothetical protein
MNEYRIFKPVEITIRRGLRYKEKNRGDEPIRIIIHIYMEMSQGNSCIAILNKQKCHFFFCYKNKEQKGKAGPVWGLVPVGGERGWGKGTGG